MSELKLRPPRFLSLQFQKLINRSRLHLGGDLVLLRACRRAFRKSMRAVLFVELHLVNAQHHAAAQRLVELGEFLGRAQRAEAGWRNP